VPPSATATSVVAWRKVAALGAATDAPRRGDVDHQAFGVKLDIEHAGPFQTQQGRE
jgi:hypothetical protein